MKKNLLIVCFFCFSHPLFASHNPDVIVVDYGSQCCGPASSSMLINYLNQFELKHNLEQLHIKQSSWGREGEYNLIINIQTLSTDLRTELLEGLQGVIEMHNQFYRESDGTSGSVKIDPNNHYHHDDRYGEIKNIR